MDKLEQYKVDNSTNDAVVDDVAAKAYIENFALETFNRGDEAQRTNKVTKQTADTFQASATFMELASIWGPLDTEFVAKIKFAKFHALRIAKALKAGEDPNATNPVVERPPELEDTTMEDGIEAELKNMENDAGVYRPPTVESAPDSGYPSRPQSTLQDGSMAPPPLPTRTPNADLHDTAPAISPVAADESSSRAPSIGGGYFPAVPDEPSSASAQPPPVISPSDPADFYNTSPPQASLPPTAPIGTQPQDRPSAPTPHHMLAQPAAAPTPLPRQPVSSLPPAGGYMTDDDSIMAAQKHARWAISALNFEDVDTAVKELRIALNNLGAS
jgi:vacuolar protein sorting-associated protein VTA1